MVEEKKEKEILVVKDLPTQQIRTFKGEDKKEYEILTIEEALGEILKTVKNTNKKVS